MDEEVIAWRIRPFILGGKPFLIGGATPFGFHVGPIHYYLSAIFLAVTKLDPIGWGIEALLFSALTLALTMIVGRAFYQTRTGILFGLLWATSFVAVASDRHWWPLTLHPLLTLVTALALFNITRGKKTWWILLGFILGFAWQAELSTGILYLATIPVIIKNLKKDRKHIVLALTITLISLIPLIIFEFRHPGANIGKLFSYQPPVSQNSCRLLHPDLCLIQIGAAITFASQALSRLLFPLTHLDGNLLNFYTWCSPIAKARVSGQPVWAATIAALVLILPLWRWWKMRKIADGILSLFIVSGLGGILLFYSFGGNVYDFYLATIYPIFLLSAAVILSAIWKRQRWMGVATLLLILGINLIALSKAFHPQGLKIKKEAVSWTIGQVQHSPFALESLSGCNRYNGIRYLFMLSGFEPTMSFMDPNYFWLYDRQPDTNYPDLFVVFATPKDLAPQQEVRYNEIQHRLITKKSFGDLEVLIVNNEDKSLNIDF